MNLAPGADDAKQRLFDWAIHCLKQAEPGIAMFKAFATKKTEVTVFINYDRADRTLWPTKNPKVAAIDWDPTGALVLGHIDPDPRESGART